MKLNHLNKLLPNQIDNAISFKRVYLLYYNKLYKYILRKSGSDYLADEVVQLSFIKLWEKRNKINPDVPLVNQIFQIAKCIMIDLLRKEQSLHKLKQHQLIHPHRDELDSTFDLLYAKELLHKLSQLIDTMPPVRAKVFKMSRLDELSHKEIAEELQISTKTVENHIGSALKSLRNNF